MDKQKRIVIVGATSAIAKQCARLWVQGKSVDLTLVGRDANRVERVAADLRTRSPQSDIRVVQAEFLNSAAIQALVDSIVAQGMVNIVLIAHGSSPKQSTLQTDLAVCRETLEITGISPVLYAEAFAKHMAQVNYGTLALIGSIAGDRGRKSNYVYGSAKSLVNRYAQGLQHRFAGTEVRVVLIKPGPTDTPMTAHLKGRGALMASVENVAQGIVDAVERGQAVAYVPGIWRLIMWVIRHIPASVFNKLNV